MTYKTMCKKLGLPTPETAITEVVFDKQKEKRYLLEKRWKKQGLVLCAFMMNPSSASHLKSDQTVDQLVEFAKTNNYSALIVVNAISFIEPQSKKLKNSTIHAVDSTNWSFIEEAFNKSDCIIFATGHKGQQALYKFIDSKDQKVINILKKYRKKFYCFDLTLSEDKKYKNDFYYTPHLRPQKNKNKYVGMPLKPISKFANYQKIFRE